MFGITEGVIHSEIHVYKMQDGCLDLFQKYLRKEKYATPLHKEYQSVW